jgi:hypothetical protein
VSLQWRFAGWIVLTFVQSRGGPRIDATVVSREGGICAEF